MANLHIENFIDTVTINCKCSLQPIHFYISAKLQKTNGFSRHLGGPWGVFMVNLKVLSWILHAWTTRQKQYWTIQMSLCPQPSFPAGELLARCLRWAGADCQAARSRWRSHQIINECLSPWAHGMLLCLSRGAIKTKCIAITTASLSGI